MNKLILTFIACSVFPILAFAQTAPSDSMSSMSPSASLLSAQDKLFIKKASYAGLAEVSDGSLAESKGSATVQKIGTTMVTDHTKLNDQLTSLSKQLGDPAPTTTDATHLQMHTTLAGLSGSAFDAKYLKDEKLGHENTIALFKVEAHDGSNTQLKNLAMTALPILQSHLNMIDAASSTTAAMKMGTTTG